MGNLFLKFAFSRSIELLRILQQKSSSANITNDLAKTVICIDLAATLLNQPIPEEDLKKSSGLRKADYNRARRTIETLLDLGRCTTINEICIQLGLNEVKTAALDVLSKYQQFVPGDDLKHPQYAAMAVFMACKRLKMKPPKQKLTACSQLRAAQWNLLEKKFENMLEAVQPVAKKQIEENMEVDIASDEEEDTEAASEEKRDEVEDYYVWKARVLKKAYEDLEDCILGT